MYDPKNRPVILSVTEAQRIRLALSSLAGKLSPEDADLNTIDQIMDTGDERAIAVSEVVRMFLPELATGKV